MSKKTIPVQSQQDFFPIHDFDYIELYAGNAKQTSYFLSRAFGYKIVAFCGLETGQRDHVSYLLEQRKTRIVVTGSLKKDHPITEFIKKHGEGVKDIALRVDDVEKAYAEAIARGGIAVMEPQTMTDEQGTFKKAIIGTYGDTVHTLVERKDYNGLFMPGYKPVTAAIPYQDAGLIGVDHVVGNVERMDEWVSYYEKVMGFKEMLHYDDEDIRTEYSALMSKVIFNGGRIKMPINEPATGRRKSQIEEYLEFNNGPGVQHVALLTTNIVATVKVLKENGVEFLDTPDAYYEELTNRVGVIDEDVQKLREYKILVDRDEDGYLLQIFTKPLVDRPTLFFEIIQRKGATTFGEGNFRALFESIEREQARRGNL